MLILEHNKKKPHTTDCYPNVVPGNTGSAGDSAKLQLVPGSRDFSDRRPFNNVPCGPGEILMPVVVNREMMETLQQMGLDWSNVETWHFSCSVRVAFVPVRENQREVTRRYFNDQLRRYLSGNGLLPRDGTDHKGIDRAPTLSYSDLYEMETDTAQTDGTALPLIPHEDGLETEALTEVFLQLAEARNPDYGVLLRGIIARCKRSELIEMLGITGSRSARYRKLDRMMEQLGRLYWRYFSG